MLNRAREACVLSFFMLVLSAGCSKGDAPRPEAPPAAPAPAASAPASPSGEVLFGQKCSVCHDLSMATSRKETREMWADIVKEMQSKREGWISDGEAAKIVDFLAEKHGAEKRGKE